MKSLRVHLLEHKSGGGNNLLQEREIVILCHFRSSFFAPVSLLSQTLFSQIVIDSIHSPGQTSPFCYLYSFAVSLLPSPLPRERVSACSLMLI